MAKVKNVLVTCGPTWVPIDDVRVISNISTGELGQRLAQGLAQKGARVTVLLGPVTQQLVSKPVRVLNFRFFDELRDLLNQELKKSYDVVIHAAAVSDFQLKRPFKAKLRSGKRLTLELVATAKLIEGIKRKNPNIFLVGFKLEPTLNKNSVRRFARDLFKKAKCDLVVVNSLNRGQYSAFIVNKDNKIIAGVKNRKSIVQALIKTI